MNTLTFAKPLVLVLVGLPGAGKSFFARQFAEMFKAPLVSYDRLQYELFSSPQFTAEEHDLLLRLVHHQTEELLKTKRSILIDGGHNAKPDRQTLAALAKTHGYDVMAIWVQTDEPTAKLRTAKRNPQKVDDRYSPTLNTPQFVELRTRLVIPQKEIYVVISGKHAFSTQAKMVLRKLSTPHAQEATTVYTQEPKPVARGSVAPRPRSDQPAGRRSVIIS